MKPTYQVSTLFLVILLFCSACSSLKSVSEACICPTNAIKIKGKKCKCYCKDGFEGDNCEIAMRTKILGEYGTGMETTVINKEADTINLILPVIIKASSEDVTIIKAYNFGGWDPSDYVELKVETYTKNGQLELSIPPYVDKKERVFKTVNKSGKETSCYYNPEDGSLTGTYTVFFSDGNSETYTFTYKR